MRHALAVTATLCLGTLAMVQAQDGSYRAGKDIPIGGEGGWDYLTVDSAAHRLYVSHATHVVVIDTQTAKIVGDIPDTPGVHGVAIAAELGRGFVSNGRENKSSIFDLKTLKLIQKVDTGENPDAILYEPAHKEIYTMNGRGKSATVIDAAQRQGGGDDSARRQAGNGAGGLQGRQDLREHGGPELGEGHRHGDAQGHRDLAGRAVRGGHRYGDRSGEPPPLPRLRQQAAW